MVGGNNWFRKFTVRQIWKASVLLTGEEIPFPFDILWWKSSQYRWRGRFCKPASGTNANIKWRWWRDHQPIDKHCAFQNLWKCMLTTHISFLKAILREAPMYAPKQQKLFATLVFPEDDLSMWFHNLLTGYWKERRSARQIADCSFLVFTVSPSPYLLF